MVELALAVVKVIAEGAAGNAAWEGVTALARRVRAKFEDRDEATTALAAVEERPDDPAAQLSLASLVAAAMESDPAFRDEVTGLLKNAAAQGVSAAVVYNQATGTGSVAAQSIGNLNVSNVRP